MYYIWKVSKRYPNLYWLKYDREKNPNYLTFMKNERVNVNCDILFHLDKKASITNFAGYDFIRSDGVSLVSNKLAELIDKAAGEGVQLIPSQVYQNDKFVGQYFIPNVLNVIDCIDKDKSVIDEYGDYLTLTIKKNSLKDLIIVRADDYRDWDFIVQKSFVQLCNNAKIKGIDFYKEPFKDPLYND